MPTQVWPALVSPPQVAASAAASGSASASTIIASLPPHSSSTGVSVSAHAAMIFLPVRVDPVKASLSTPAPVNVAPVSPLRVAEPGPPGGRLAGPADRGGDLRRPGDREPAHLLAAGRIRRDQLAVLDDGDAGRAGGGHVDTSLRSASPRPPGLSRLMP